MVLRNYLLLVCKHKLFKLLYVTVFFIIALEIVARIIWGTNSTKLFEVTLPDFILHHRTKPNFTGVDNARSIPYTLRTNSQGWVEDYDISLAKPSGTYRIFYVGDSNTVGLVDPPGKMVDIVERGLNEVYNPKGTKVELINTGTSSYSPLIYYLLIKNEIIKYQPDLVVINVDMTDVVNDAAYRKTVIEDKDGIPLAVRPNFGGDKSLYRLTPQGTIKISRLLYFKEQLHRILTSHSVLYNYFEKLVYRLGGRKLPFLQPHNVVYDTTDQSANWLAKTWTKEIEENVAYSMKVLGYAIDVLKLRKVKVMLTGVPHYPQFTGEWSDLPHEVLEQTARKYGIPYLNTYGGMKKSGIEANKLFWQEDPTHLNIEGNALWGKIQLEFLLEKKNELLPFNTTNNQIIK